MARHGARAACVSRSASSSRSQPTRLPSSDGMRPTNSRSPAQSVPRRAVHQAEVVVGMRRPMRPQRQHPAAEVEVEPVLHQPGRGQRGAAGGGLAHLAVQHAAVELAALRQGGGQLRMADDLGAAIGEGGRAHDVVGMDMGEDEVADRQRRRRFDGLPQQPAMRQAAARVDHRDRIAADDEAGIGQRVEIVRRGVLIEARQDEDAGSDLGGSSRRDAAAPSRAAATPSITPRREAAADVMGRLRSGSDLHAIGHFGHRTASDLGAGVGVDLEAEADLGDAGGLPGHHASPSGHGGTRDWRRGRASIKRDGLTSAWGPPRPARRST